MLIERVALPRSLGMPGVLEVCQSLHALRPADGYEIDFSTTQHFEPFGMLLVGSAIRRIGERTTSDGDPVSLHLVGKSPGKQGHDYARRLGFWWSIGDDQDLPTVKREASTTTIPITRLSIQDLYRQSAGMDPVRSEVVSRAAADLVTTLCGSNQQTALWLSLEYCLREMFRNVVEHSRADAIWYAAATRPRKDDVQIAILDGGRGIRDSLADNPSECYRSDIDAVRAALRPGVSRNSGRARSAAQTHRLLDDFPGQDPSLYDNSGFGLTLTSNLAMEAGQFALVSGSSCLAFVGKAETVSETRHAGTAVRIVLAPSRLDGALDRAQLKANRDAGKRPHSGSLISASAMTRLGLKHALVRGKGPL